MKPSHDLHIDFETYCELDLKKVGMHRYTAHPSFRILCVAWKVDDQKTRSADTFSRELRLLLMNSDYQGHAWNAAFETAVLYNRLNLVPVNPISCTMQRALAYGLPAKLEKAAEALGLASQKDMPGHRLMLRMSRPLKAGAPPWTQANYETLAEYCAKDVEAEAAAAAVIPELSPDERELALLDARMNTDGELGVDLDRTRVLQDVAEAAERLDAERCTELTGGAVTSPGTQTAKLLAWLASRCLVLPDVARTTIEEALAEITVDRENLDFLAVVEVLQIRLRTARGSTKKLAAMLNMSDPATAALPGQFQFVGAGRTGRWSGRGVQVQNLPRVPKSFDPDLFTAMAARCAIAGDDRIFDAVTSAPTLDCVSWSLRSCLKATDDDKILWSFDFSQIEARVLAWLAGQQDVLQVFANGDDVYQWAAARAGSKNRQLGKVLVLALGFGMGAGKLRDTARNSYGVNLTANEAERFKNVWRADNSRIVEFWHAMERAARAAILQRSVQAVGGSGVAFTSTGRTLQMRLPSGRVLYYHKPRLDMETGSIVYWGAEVGGRWTEQRTWGGKLAENATQAVARDIMSEAMLRVWRRLDRVPCMTVHDELVYVLRERTAVRCGNTLAAEMLEPPPWAGGLPLAGEHKLQRRYGVPAQLVAIADAA